MLAHSLGSGDDNLCLLFSMRLTIMNSGQDDNAELMENLDDLYELVAIRSNPQLYLRLLKHPPALLC